MIYVHNRVTVGQDILYLLINLYRALVSSQTSMLCTTVIITIGVLSEKTNSIEILNAITKTTVMKEENLFYLRIHQLVQKLL